MKILNIMLSRGLGGIEQSYTDYSNLLSNQNIEHKNISSYFAKVNSSLKPDYSLMNLGSWDPLSKAKLGRIITKEKPDIIIAHGRRAAEFALASKNSRVKIIGITHSEKLKVISKCDHIIVLTNSMKKEAIKQNIPDKKISILPNSVDITQFKQKPDEEFASPAIIGAMGRLVYKKGFDIFLESLSILKKEGIQFKAIIAGSGPEEKNLKSMSEDLGLNNFVEFTGWTKDKNEFFKKIDIFCLPSRSEPFGIVLLESMASKVPILSTRCSGPVEIIDHLEDGVLLDETSPEKLANAIEHMINCEEEARKYAQTAFDKITKKYDKKVLSKELKKIIEKLKG